jgi:hypothetical protein
MNGRSSTSFYNLSFRGELIVKRSAQSRNPVLGSGRPMMLTVAFVVSHALKSARW